MRPKFKTNHRAGGIAHSAVTAHLDCIDVISHKREVRLDLNSFIFAIVVQGLRGWQHKTLF